jgi:hypothetical protein
LASYEATDSQVTLSGPAVWCSTTACTFVGVGAEKDPPVIGGHALVHGGDPGALVGLTGDDVVLIAKEW